MEGGARPRRLFVHAMDAQNTNHSHASYSKAMAKITFRKAMILLYICLRIFGSNLYTFVYFNLITYRKCVSCYIHFALVFFAYSYIIPISYMPVS